MASYRLTNEAGARLAAIHEYSILNWGLRTARNYLDGLHDTLQLLAKNPRMGRNMGTVRPNLRRHPHGSHVIYYRPDGEGVMILDILGERQDPGRHL